MLLHTRAGAKLHERLDGPKRIEGKEIEGRGRLVWCGKEAGRRKWQYNALQMRERRHKLNI